MKILIFLLIMASIVLIIISLINTIRLNSVKRKMKQRYYKVPKLSSLHGKKFKEYIDYLIKDL